MGEIVPDAEGREIAAVLCADVSQVEVREGDNPLEFCLCGVDGGGRSVPLEYQDLLLFTPLNPEAGHPLRRFDAALDAVLNGAAAENLRRDGKELGPLRQCALCGDL